MSKITEIKIENFKSIDSIEVDFKGCTAIVTGGNNKGKSSLLKGITDRIRFVRPNVILKEGTTKGKGEMKLDTGEKFIWEFDNEGKDKLVYVTPENIKTSVTVELGKKFFPALFDIDKFLQSPPKKQIEQLQQIIGIDFTEIDSRYQAAYDARTEANRNAEKYQAKLSSMLKCDKVVPIDLSKLQEDKLNEKNRLNQLYLDNKLTNKNLRTAWENEKTIIDNQIKEENEKIQLIENNNQKLISFKNRLENLLNEFSSYKQLVDYQKLNEKIANSPVVQYKEAHYPIEPTYIEEIPDSTLLDEIDAQILQASDINKKADEYTAYVNYKAFVENAEQEAKDADDLVKSIELERKKLIASANMPKGIEITLNGITVDGFPLNRDQISTSKLYTSALRIASMNLGEVKTLYFDASFLDKNSLLEIQKWAEQNSLQLLIERPSWEDTEIQYEIIETLN